MSWTPPVSLEEKLKQSLIPPSWYIRYLYRRELARGEREIHLIPRLARRNKVSIDVGANKGVYSYALLRHSAAVHGFEPNPKAYRMLESWAKDLISLHQLALSDRPGKSNFTIPLSAKGYSNQRGRLSSEADGRSVQGTLAVETARLDDLEIDNVGFMKIDVEGHESRVLKGAVETLKRDKPNLLVEIEERHTGEPLSDTIGKICDYGYRCHTLADGALIPFNGDKPVLDPPGDPGYQFNFIFLPV